MLTPLLLLTSSALAVAETPSLHEGYRDADTLDGMVSQVAATAPELATVSTYGESREGRPLRVITLGRKDDRRRPAMLVVAGLDPLHRAGCEYALVVTRTLLRDHADLLEEMDVHLIPVANPDAFHALDQVADGRRGVNRPVDADRDGLLDEDPPTDLDGDGRVLWIRTTTPPRGTQLTHVIDPTDPRQVRVPDEKLGEHATHAIFTEGLDRDGDGLIAEDGPGETRLDHNFMHLYRPHLATAGPHQLSEPESLALATFVLEHPEILSAVVFGPHDTVISPPDHKTLDITGKVPTGITEADRSTYDRFGETYRELLGESLSHDEDDAGSFHAWLYAQRGVPVAAVTGWGPSTEAVENEESKTSPPTPEERWTELLDRAGPTHATVEWKAFDHPTLGAVEIGGEIRGARLNPPASELTSIGEKHAAFIAAIAADRPMLTVEPVAVESLPGGLLRVDLKVRNSGRHPLRTEMARRNRAIRPLLLKPMVPRDRIVAGTPIERIETLDGEGGAAEASWIIRDDGEPFEIAIDDPQFGVQTVTVSAEGGDS